MVDGYPGQHWTGHNPHGEEPQLLNLLEQLTMPVVVAVGEDDVPCFREMSAVLARRIPAAEHHVIPGAGHLTIMEQPEIVNELIVQIMRRI
jgi:pimeloyl-ACP methyl ester carboxylesterase